MGRDKATLPFGPETMVERVVRIVSPFVDDIVVVARRGQSLPPLERIAWDDVDDQGPLGGLVAGLSAASGSTCLVVACDQPLLAPALVELLFGTLEAFEAVIPRVDGYLVPTCAVYRRDVLGGARALLQSGERKLALLAERIDAFILEEPELREADPTLASFRPCNTVAEYHSLLREAGLSEL